MATVDDNGDVQPQTDEEKASGKTRFEEGYGVVKNVGTIKSLAVTTMGMNFPHGVYVLLKILIMLKTLFHGLSWL